MHDPKCLCSIPFCCKRSKHVNSCDANLQCDTLSKIHEAFLAVLVKAFAGISDSDTRKIPYKRRKSGRSKAEITFSSETLIICTSDLQHWHGLTQRTSPFSDGTPLASQWPIPPHHYFDYEFQLFPGDAGTYFYHSHVGFGAVTAFGALIVEEPLGVPPPYTYDDEKVFLISDSFHLNDSFIEQGLLANPFQWSGEIDNIQLNGKSRFINASTSNFGLACSLALVTLTPETLYRVRFIGATALSQVFFAMESHLEMILMEVDGLYVAPVQVDHIEIHSGQRYSVLLRAKSIERILIDRSLGINR